jgi:hypothetical protein
MASISWITVELTEEIGHYRQKKIEIKNSHTTVRFYQIQLQLRVAIRGHSEESEIERTFPVDPEK